MVDKPTTILRSKVGQILGQADQNIMSEVDRCLAVFIGIAK